MKKKDRLAFFGYVRHLADECGLKDWYFDIYFEDRDAISRGGGVPDEDDGEMSTTLAYVDVAFGQKRANITFRDDLREWSSERLRYVVCHELTHCHLHQVQDIVEDDLWCQLGRPARDLYMKSFRRNLELAVDGIASAMAEKMPAIEWPD